MKLQVEAPRPQAVSESTRSARSRTWVVWLSLGVGGLLLLYWAYRQVPLTSIGDVLSQIRLWQVAVLISVNCLFHVLMGLRWWIIGRSDIQELPLADIILVRLSAFGLSYFSPGPQVGGEPLQVLYLRRSCGATFARATATVIMDRLIEFLANFIFLVVGAALLFRQGVITGSEGVPPGLAVAIVAVASWPALHLWLLSRRRYPVSAVARLISGTGPLRKVGRLIRASEHLAGRFCQRKPRALLGAVGVSIVAVGVAVMEYGLVTSFLHVRLDVWQIAAAWAAGWISFLLPLPGGLGALEASQVIALGRMGAPAAAALSVTLLLRARDAAFGGLGILLAITSVRYLTMDKNQTGSIRRMNG
jgi:uncharacterized protein (TIRG00374 family)